ncbi:MAG: ATP-binding protein [Acidobacteriota bacterium]
MDYERLGMFYLGRQVAADTATVSATPLLYDASDLVTHAVILGMTGSGKTGLGIGLMEEAAIDGVPVIAVDPKGDLSNLLLTFPGLTAAEFAPWVNPEEARLLGLDEAAFAAREADRWREGLAQWGQSPDRIARLRGAAETVLYTPGSRSARPLSILRTFQAPSPSVLSDPELLAERATAAATSVLTLAGLDVEPRRSREHILISMLLAEAWQREQSLDLAALISQVQTPPVQKVGVLELDAFYPPADRFALAADLNHLLAAPDFAVWLEGEPLDINSLFYDSHGKPRLSILSIAHLDDRERMFFVSLLLNELVAWMRAQRGTSTLRALVYIDEMTGFLPPVAMPASKAPLLTLLKQARAFGLGMTLATQNPVDLDYKALANAGTWFLGRLQTERDKARLLDGLEGANAASGHGFDRATTDRLLSSLDKRTFLLHNVHDSAPTLFKTRWTLSYLRGPLGRDELRRLAATTPVAPVAPAAPAAPVAPSTPVAPGPVSPPAAPIAPAAPALAGSQGAPVVPVLPPSIQQYFAPGVGQAWAPSLVGAARVAYRDSKLGIDDTRDIIVATPIVDGPIPVDWEHAEPASFAVNDLQKTPAREAPFDPLPKAAARPEKYTAWAKDFGRWAGQSQAIELIRSPKAKLTSEPGESERDFRIRLQTALREARDEEMSKLRERYASRLSTLDDRLRRAAAAVEREQEQASESKMQTGVSIAAAIAGAILGRKSVSLGTLGRATTAARGVGRIGRSAQDVERARADLDALQETREALAKELEDELAAIAATWDARDEPLEPVLVRPKRGGVSVQLVALVWHPR